VSGIFGGSFDPIHLGHLIVARSAAEQLRLEVVRFVPARIQPFKTDRQMATPEDRLAMLQLALADQPGFEVDDREIRRKGTSYTIDTLRELRAEAPEDQLCLLVGADAARELPDWREARLIPELSRIVVLTRPGVKYALGELEAELIEVPEIDISATEIRRRVRDGEPIDELVPPAVAEYIESHGLYSTRD
jgi:nicotinate-nucleotide adenylyltransferase